MVISVVPMEKEHIVSLKPQFSQSNLSLDERIQITMKQKEHGPCWAALLGKEVIGVAGVSAQWEGRGVAWCILSETAGPHMVAITRIVRRYLGELSYRRLEFYVDAQFAAGCRWANLLGFTLETPEPMQFFFPNGNDAYLYGRVR